MDVEQLIYMNEIVKAKVFNKAAETLKISPALLTKKVKALEKDLNFKIFERNNTLCKLTSEGELFYHRIQPLLINYDKFKQKYDLASSQTTIIGNFFTSTQNAFVNLKDKENITYEDMTIEEAVRKISTKETSFGILAMPTNLEKDFLQNLKALGLCFEKIFTTKLHCIVGKGSSLYDRTFLTKEALKDKTLVTFKYFQEENQLQRYFQDMDLQYGKIIYIQEPLTGIEILNNYDAFFLAGKYINSYCLMNGLISLPLVDYNTFYNYYLIKNKGNTCPLVQAYKKEFLKEIGAYKNE